MHEACNLKSVLRFTCKTRLLFGEHPPFHGNDCSYAPIKSTLVAIRQENVMWNGRAHFRLSTYSSSFSEVINWALTDVCQAQV